MNRYRRRLRATIASQGPAYGFTLTVWGTGTLAIAMYGKLTVVHALYFVAGPLLMYALLLLVLYRPHEPPASLMETPYSVYAYMDLVSVPLAIGSSLVVFYSVPNPRFGLTLGAFTSTLVYNLLLAMQVALSRQGRKERDGRA